MKNLTNMKKCTEVIHKIIAILSSSKTRMIKQCNVRHTHVFGKTIKEMVKIKRRGMNVRDIQGLVRHQ